MPKSKDQPSTKPSSFERQDLSDLKAMLAGVTFKGAKRGYHAPLKATDRIGMVAAAYKTEHPELSLNQCLTMTFTAYWQMYDERG